MWDGGGGMWDACTMQHSLPGAARAALCNHSKPQARNLTALPRWPPPALRPPGAAAGPHNRRRPGSPTAAHGGDTGSMLCRCTVAAERCGGVGWAARMPLASRPCIMQDQLHGIQIHCTMSTLPHVTTPSLAHLCIVVVGRRHAGHVGVPRIVVCTEQGRHAGQHGEGHLASVRQRGKRAAPPSCMSAEGCLLQLCPARRSGIAAMRGVSQGGYCWCCWCCCCFCCCSWRRLC